MANRQTFQFVFASRRSGFTLVEILISTTLAMILLVSVIQIFIMMSDGFSQSRVLLDLLGRVRSAQQTLQSDLAHYTTPMTPPRPASADDGYFSCGKLSNAAVRSYDSTKESLTWVSTAITERSEADYHYIALTVCKKDTPFRYTNNGVICETPYAEVVWFVYKNDLYRICVPFVPAQEGIEPNTYRTTIPAFREVGLNVLGHRDYRIMSYLSAYINGGKLSNFLILPNVIQFQVFLWDPNLRQFESATNLKTSVYFNTNVNSVGQGTYDTWSSMMMTDTTQKALTRGLGSRVAVNNENVYSDTYAQAPPTHAFLPGIRVVARAFDVDTGQVREFRVAQDFRRW